MPLVEVGSEFRVNADAALGGRQSYVSVAGHADGSFLVAWEGPFEDVPPEEVRSYFDVFARAFDADGAVGGDFMVNTTTRDPQFEPHVAARPDGSYVVAYASGVEDGLPGTYVATQLLTNTGGFIGPEGLADDNYYHMNPDVAVFADGSFVVVSDDEPGYSEPGDGYVYTAGGALVSQFGFAYGGFGREAVTEIGGDDFALFWEGYDRPDPLEDDDPSNDEEERVYGLYGQVRSLDGGIGPVFAISVFGSDSIIGADPEAALLTNGDVAVCWTGPTDGGFALLAAVIDPGTGSFVVSPFEVADGFTASFDLEALGSGGFALAWTTGPSVAAAAYGANGAPLGGPLLIDADTGFGVSTTSLAAIGDSRFVVVWDDATGIRAQVLELTTYTPPTGFLYTRPGTQDGSAPGDETLTGPDWRNTFFFDVGEDTGDDRIANFGPDDLLVTDEPLPDSDGDGIVTFGRNGVLDLDGADGPSDTVEFEGSGLSEGLRYLGELDGLHAYADASVRPDGAIEGTLGADTLSGDAADIAAEVFFYDTALDVPLGADTMVNFGANDRFVTTTALFDGNGDGIIGFAASGLRLSGGVGGPGDPGAPGEGGTVAIRSLAGVAITQLKYDGVVSQGGVDYFVYSLPGSTVGTGGLFE